MRKLHNQKRIDYYSSFDAFVVRVVIIKTRKKEYSNSVVHSYSFPFCLMCVCVLSPRALYNNLVTGKKKGTLTR